MKKSLVALAALVAVSLTTGCSLLESATAAPTSSPTAKATAKATAQPTADTGTGSVKDEGDIPDPCTLLSKAEVTSLTGRKITQIDEDGAEPGEATRFCQWQQDGGQLAIFLGRTTPADFEVVVDEAEPVDGIGEDAFLLSDHLYVLYGTVQIDVYSRGGSDSENLADAKKVARTLIPRV
ncbi:DUF3558 family protein [Actinoplanes sp. TRM 88003]|uniref:DUF3558 family protein n=1 Tax=Paractinoplanes aksuensis TaxID=2939490 RepID=A0ABT1DQW7_9ACTN|nr:DUF3558 family protein [Actinoplanes aksuensis]MCO8273241.1 DUF3558 family protein [Actinoplanes aksuensis]